MDVLAAARALNQKSVRQNWHHICDPTLSFSNDSYQGLLDLWRIKAGNRNMPSRSDFTPRDLKPILRHVLMIERISKEPSRFRWRLVGSGLTNVLGENTGKTFDESIPSQHLERWTECGNLILEGGQPLRFLGHVHVNGHEYLNAENLFVPLANDNGEPQFMLGQCSYKPRRCERESEWENELASLPGGLL